MNDTIIVMEIKLSKNTKKKTGSYKCKNVKKDFGLKSNKLARNQT